jgi:hypothetical protein
MNDIRFDLPGAQPSCQPEAVSAGFERNDNACHGLTGLDGFVAPAMQQPKQSLWVGHCELLQRITCDTGNHSANQPG